MPQNKTFKIGKLELEYCTAEYNHAAINERTVEVPLAIEFTKKFKYVNGPLGTKLPHMDFIEIGCVTPYYYPPDTPWICNTHKVYDLFDPHPICIKTDATKENYLGKDVLSISTIEHIGTSDYGATPGDPHSAFTCLDKIVKTAANYLITWPIGYNKVLDKDLYDSNIDYKMIARDCDNNWFDPSRGEYALMSALSRSDIFNFQYSKPFTCGNAIVIVSNLPEIMD